MNLDDFFNNLITNFDEFKKIETIKMLTYKHDSAKIKFNNSDIEIYKNFFNQIVDPYYFNIDSFSFNSEEDEISILLRHLETTDKNLNYEIEFFIHNKNHIDDNNNINIYDVESFFNNKNSSIEGYYLYFNNIFKNTNFQNKIIFTLIFDNFYLETETMIFKTIDKKNLVKAININREHIVSNFVYNSKLLSKNELGLLPNDFRITGSKKIPVNIKKYFNKMEEFLSLIYISTLTRIRDDNSFEIIINGMKNINANINFYTFYNNGEFNNFFKIYNWIYNDSSNDNISDKIGLARNILSLHIKNNDSARLSIDDETYDSIISSHKIYLKENVEKYLSTLNNISNSLFDIKNKVNDLFSEYLTSFRSNVYIYMTFLISFVIKYLFENRSAESYENLFSIEIAILISIVVMISFFYKSFTINAINKKGKRLSKNVDNLKSRYETILDTADIENIFKDIDIKNELKNEINSYNYFWFGLNISVLLIIWILYFITFT